MGRHFHTPLAESIGIFGQTGMYFRLILDKDRWGFVHEIEGLPKRGASFNIRESFDETKFPCFAPQFIVDDSLCPLTYFVSS
jgi:hypothetical protein